VLALVLPALAGPAAPAGQAAERRAPPVTVTPPPDDAIQRRIEGILRAVGGIEELQVEVRSGVVRLAGHADSLALHEQATDLAGRVEGVVLVRNDLQVATDVRGRLAPTWTKVKGYLARTLGFLPVLGIALAAFVAFALLAKWVGRWPFRLLHLSELATSILRATLRAVLLVTGLVLALDLLGLIAFVGKVVGALGLLGVVAGIAFRDVVANFLPGFMLGLDPPFASGDDVQIGEHSGRVVRVTPRETILVTYDGQHLRIPNVSLLQKPILNFERYRERRLHFPIDVALSADLRRVRDVGRETLLSLPGLLRKPRPFIRVVTIQADLVRVAFYAWADQHEANFLDVASRARQAVKEALVAAGVPFPVPELAIHMAGAEAAQSLEEDEPGGPDEALVEAHLREEEVASGGRDLLREGRSPATRAPARGA